MFGFGDGASFGHDYGQNHGPNCGQKDGQNGGHHPPETVKPSNRQTLKP